jgi:hypothetical protein
LPWSAHLHVLKVAGQNGFRFAILSRAELGAAAGRYEPYKTTTHYNDADDPNLG